MGAATFDTAIRIKFKGHQASREDRVAVNLGGILRSFRVETILGEI